MLPHPLITKSLRAVAGEPPSNRGWIFLFPVGEEKSTQSRTSGGDGKVNCIVAEMLGGLMAFDDFSLAYYFGLKNNVYDLLPITYDLFYC